MGKRNGNILQRIMTTAVLFTAVLVIGMAAAAAPVNALAADISASGTDWTLDNEGKLTITSDAGMKNWASSGNDKYGRQVKNVVISNGVTSIGQAAFSKCDRLTGVEVPNSVTSIGLYAFYQCSSLKGIKIPNGVTSIGIQAFFECYNLTSIKIPDSVTSIGGSVFCNCRSLTSVVMSNSVTSIGERAFSSCYSLKSINIPNSVKSIGNYAFSDCSLTSIKIPGSVTKIGDYAFSKCRSLTSVTMLGETPPALGNNVFSESGFVSKKITAIYIPAGKAGNYQQAWAAWKDYIYIAADLDLDPTSDDYADSTVEVQGFTRDTVVYSVDVEWGAMTFQWKGGSWDPETHMRDAGSGWKVYDSNENKAMDETRHSINEIKLTNHSNAEVWAVLSYESIEEYAPDTTGSFEPENLYLDTADNDGGDGEGVGKATVGEAYFMPVNLKKDLQKEDGITKWTQIGTITVGIVTEEP